MAGVKLPNRSKVWLAKMFDNDGGKGWLADAAPTVTVRVPVIVRVFVCAGTPSNVVFVIADCATVPDPLTVPVVEEWGDAVVIVSEPPGVNG